MQSTLASKIIGGFAVALLLVAAAAGLSWHTTTQLIESATQARNTQKILTRLADLHATLTDAETGVRGYTITGNEAFLEPYHSAVARADAEFQTVRRLTLDNPRQQHRLDTLAPLLTARLNRLREVITVRRAQGFAATQALIAAGGGKQIQDAIRGVISALEDEERRLLVQREADAHADARLTLWVIGVSGAGMLLLCGAMLVVTRRGFRALRRTQDALSAATTWQQTLLDSADRSIIATDPQGVIRTFNRVAERLLGYTAAEVVGKLTPAVIHDAEEVRARAVELSRELGRVITPGFEVFVAQARAGTPEERDWTYVRKDGSRFPVRLSVTAMFDAAGHLTGFLGIAADLSARRREEQRFHQVVEAAPNGLVTIDAAGLITLVNAQTEQLFGYACDELLGRPIEMLLPERFRAAHPGQRHGYFADPGVRAMGVGRDLYGLRKDGREIPIEVGLSPLVTAAGTTVLASIVDITERRRAEEQLLRLRREHERILNTVDFGIHGLDLNGNITFENPYAAALFGRDTQEMIGRPAHALIHHTRADGTPYPVGECHIYATLRDGKSRHVEDEVFWRQDGTNFPVAYTSTPLHDEAGALAGALVSFRDITERRRAEAALRQLNEELRVASEQAQAADRLKSAFLAAMSHELRTPLNSVIGFTGVLLQGLSGPLNTEQAKQLGMVQDSARHLLALINDVLDISKIEAGQLNLSLAPFDPRASITKVIGIVTPLAEKKALELRVRLAPALGEGVGDARRFEQILLNLLGNAIKFTEHGAVTLTAEPVNGTAGPAICLRVTDTGIGIKAEDLPALFQPFRQLDSGLSRNYEGTGLGLAICRRLAELMGGRIEVESTWGAGSTFSLTLPLNGVPA